MEQWCVGMKVLCVEAGKGTPEGGVYTVADFWQCTCGRSHLRLVEFGAIVGRSTCPACSQMVGDGAWAYASRFRPLDTLTETMDRLESEGAPVEVEISEPVLNRSNNCSVT